MPIAGRDIILICVGVKGRQYNQLYILRGGQGICGQYEPSNGRCENPANSVCGTDPDVKVSCGSSEDGAPYVKITKRNLDDNDVGAWECHGTGAFPIQSSASITIGKCA